ncbi:DNA polymerase phi [Taphrina deformans PYCC 5710]|uniref:DNA polymerase phi n=1 Tax=Taphrina deformans (strain PYCC 5710 / ATCC 11124 / CBS 356.35 / IMI 108563 / JCM 9778 / NBRC 8474) TaxID=1097556 RepID=R4XCE3_TAPDE|nr:DNA polymerase phi [Taphrina deformans PYCC 5710]|eukprot:CCG83491.1 DNA polymerase phi [Taphrina deformans PYCC 5710]
MSLLEQFDYLRNHDSQKRLDATVRVFSILEIGKRSIEPVCSLDDLKTHYGDDVHYTFTRLVRGLASNRESARLGFSAALSELLRALPKLDTTFVLDAIEKATVPGGNIKGQETRDYQFGRLFGLQALCTSGLLTRNETTMEDITPVLVLLYELAMSKGWLRESCASVIIQILESLAAAKSSIVSECATTIHEMLYTSQLSKTMEGIAISLKCRERGSTKESSDWSHKDILHADNLSAINKIMRDLNTSDNEEGEKQTGTWKPKLHFAWLVVIQGILEATNPDHIEFPDFWRIVVDEGLFSTSASHERKFWGFQVFNHLVNDLSPSMVSTLFSANFLRTLGNQISQNDRYLNKAAINTTISIVNAAQNQQDKALVALRYLWDYNLYYDRLSKAKTCESLMVLVPASSLPELVTLLIGHCNPPKSKTEAITKEVEKRRQFVADCFLILLRSAQIPNTGAWVGDVLDFCTINGFFKVTKPKHAVFAFEPALTDATRQVFKTRLQSSLGLLMPATSEAKEVLWVEHVVQTFKTYRNKKYYELLLQPDETILALLDSAERKLEKLEKKRKRSATQDQALAFILMYSLTMVQVYTGESDAVQVLEDLDGCYSQLFSKTDVEDSEQDPIEVLVDLLLNFLSRESVLFRKLVDSVFAVFASKLTKPSLELLLNVLASDESGEALFDKADDNDDEEEEEGEDEEDEDMIDEDEAARASDSSSDDDDGEEDEDNEAADEERDAALDAALRNALGGKKRKASEMNVVHAGEGHESDFEADSDEEEDLLDDDQMLAMDATLENIFKRRKQESGRSRKKDRVGLKVSTIQFKRKVIDLLDQYARLCPSSGLVVETLLPLLQCARKSSDANLSERIQSLVRQRVTKAKQLPQVASTQTLLALLRQVHDEAERANTPPQLSACSQTALFLIRLTLSLDEDRVSDIVRLYGDSQLKWLNKKHSKLNTGFFVDFVNWCTQWRVNRHRSVKEGRIGSEQTDTKVEGPSAVHEGTDKKDRQKKSKKSRGKRE